jgi:hypothetical protein
MMTLQDILRREQEEQAEHSDEGETYYAGGEKSQVNGERVAK